MLEIFLPGTYTLYSNIIVKKTQLRGHLLDNPNNPVVILRFATLTPERLSR
jgi:hypothetical protein